MPTIGASVDEQTKAAFDAAAAARVLTASKLNKKLILDFLDGERQPASPRPQLLLPVPTAAPLVRGAKTEQVFVRLEPAYYADLGQRSAALGWYPGTYMRHLYYVHADRRPVLSAEEVNAVRNVARYLADLGRNVNQIAKKLNGSLDQQHLAFGLDLEQIRLLLDLEISATRALLQANLDYWGVGDGQEG